MTAFAMRIHGVKVLGQLADMTEAEFLKPRCIGRKTLNHVESVLEKYHLSFKQ
jgi:DNA-directed RNA polymerase alpha subunit